MSGFRSWFDEPFLSKVRGFTTNGITHSPFVLSPSKDSFEFH
jgi:hypothetical protein